MEIFKILTVFLICTQFKCAETYETSTYTKSYRCESDPQVATKPICQIKAVSRAVQKLRFGWTLVRETNDVHVSLVGYVKTAANRFMPGFWKLAHNYCDLFSRPSADTEFFIKAMETLNPEINNETLVRYKCPLKGTIYHESLQYKNITGTQFLVPPNEYKNIWRLYNKQNQTYFRLEEIVLVRDMSRQS